MNTSPRREPQTAPCEADAQVADSSLPDFLLSALQPCLVALTSQVNEQTPPSKTKAELLADGQCEV
ncbi:MAG: hypothetical protein JW726_00990 [Anaerolineales bacterium]|nr:hypothetical protein [Anaerolineales bacterium]